MRKIIVILGLFLSFCTVSKAQTKLDSLMLELTIEYIKNAADTIMLYNDTDFRPVIVASNNPLIVGNDTTQVYGAYMQGMVFICKDFQATMLSSNGAKVVVKGRRGQQIETDIPTKVNLPNKLK